MIKSPGTDDRTGVVSRLLPPGQELLELYARGGRSCLVPMGTARVRLSGSGVYPAYRSAARAYRTALRAWIALGGGRLTHRILSKPGDDWPLGDLLLPELPTLATAAIYVPNDPEPAITARLMDRRGHVLGYAKYADVPRRRASLANEARMLEVIPAGVGPRLIRFTPFFEGDILVQTAVSGRPYRPRPYLHTTQRSLLDRLVRPVPTYVTREHPFIQRLSVEAAQRRPLLERVVAELGSQEWSVVWMHGDFSYHNMFQWRGVCRAFDWESGAEDGFPYLDAANWTLSIAHSIQRREPLHAKRYVTAVLEAYLPAHRRTHAPAIASLAAVYALVTRYPRPQMDDHERWWTAFAEAQV